MFTNSLFFNPATSHICLLIVVGAPSATALLQLQHGIPFRPPSKIVRPYIVSSAKSRLIAQLINN